MQTRHVNTAPTVVGYQANSTAATEGYKLYAPTFLQVGKGTASTKYTIKPVALSGTVPDGSSGTFRITLQRLKPTGGTQGNALVWKDYQGAKNWVGPGWCTGIGTTVQDVSLAPGEGVMVTYPDGCNNCSMQFSGELNQEDAYIALRDGYTLLGNQQPQSLSVNEIIPTSTDPELYPVPDGQDSATRITLQRLKPTGGTQGNALVWKNYQGAKNWVGPGWCTGIGTTVQKVNLDPGEAVLVTCHDSNVAQILMKIPGVKLNK